MHKSRTMTVGAVLLSATPLTGCSLGGNGSDGDGEGAVKMVAWPGPEGDAMAKVVKAYNADQGKAHCVKVATISGLIAAPVDGASIFSTLTRIVIPMLAPTMVAVFAQRFLVSGLSAGAVKG